MTTEGQKNEFSGWVIVRDNGFGREAFFAGFPSTPAGGYAMWSTAAAAAVVFARQRDAGVVACSLPVHADREGSRVAPFMPLTQFAWVIERGDPSRPDYFVGLGGDLPGVSVGTAGYAMWYCGEGAHERAVRFSRREDAQKVFDSLPHQSDRDGSRVAEHGWG